MYLIVIDWFRYLTSTRKKYVKRQLKCYFVYEREGGEREGKREGRGAGKNRKGKIKNGKRRKVGMMRHLALGCRAGNKIMNCTRTAWSFVYLSQPLQP